jgi:AcrR family transcriptional regulator
MMSVTGTAPQNKRPRDRKQQILMAAAEQFRVSGYHNASMTGIAEAVGITSAAVYRHFRGKQELLRAILRDSVDRLVELYNAPYEDLREMFDAIAASSLQHRHAGVLWEREAENLPSDEVRRLRSDYSRVVEPIRSAIADARPDLSADDVDLLLWATQAVFASAGYHSINLEPARVRAELTDAALAVCNTAQVPLHEGPGLGALPVPRGRITPASRREAVLVASIRLFAEHGFQAVSMDDIGTAAGIAGPTLYHHFENKSAILVAALTRCLEAMLFDLSVALRFADSAEQALDRVLTSFVRVTVEHGDDLGGLLNEISSVPAGDRQSLRHLEHDYVTEWAALVCGHRPELSTREAEILVYAAQSVISSVLRIHHLRARPALLDELRALAGAVLGMPEHPSRSEGQRRTLSESGIRR